MRLKIRCNRQPCEARSTLPSNVRNVLRLRDRVITCKKCGKGKLYQLKNNRVTELAKRNRCFCNGVKWQTPGVSHSVSTPECEQYADYIIDSVLSGRKD